MRYGLEVSCGGEGVELATLIEVGLLAERSGWDAVFFEDYLVHYDGDDPPTFDPWVLLAAIASRTSRIRLGTTVTALPRRRPGKLARADGVVPYKLTDTGTWSDFTSAEIADLITEIDGHRKAAGVPGPFDVALGGRRRGPDEAAERRYLADLAAAGATWWLEFVPGGPAEQMLAAVRRGPLA